MNEKLQNVSKREALILEYFNEKCKSVMCLLSTNLKSATFKYKLIQVKTEKDNGEWLVYI